MRFYLPTFVGGLVGVLFSLVRDGEVDPVIVALFGATGVSVPFHWLEVTDRPRKPR